MNGVVQSGNGEDVRPLDGARVTLYDAGADTPEIVGQATTNDNGAFSIESPRHSARGIFYVTADLGDGIVLMAILGTTVPHDIVVNELTTGMLIWVGIATPRGDR